MKAMSIATIIVAIAGYLVIWVASKALDTTGYENFMVYWSLFFALAGVLDGLMQETARGVTARQSVSAQAPSPAPGQAPSQASSQALAQPFRTTIYFAAATLLTVGLTGLFWAEQLMRGEAASGLTLMAVGLAAYAFQATLSGLLSAAGAWKHFALLITIDSVGRLGLALLAWALGWQLLAFLIVTVMGAATWLAFLLTPTTRKLLRNTADVTTKQFTTRACKAMIASGANAVLITGFTVLLRFTSNDDVAPGALAAIITAVTLTRAPVLVPLQRFQPALIVHFTKNRERVFAASLLPIGAVLGISAVGGVAAYFLAAPLMRLFFAPELISPPAVLGGLTFIAGSTAILMISGSAALAADRHNLYTAGWVVATVIAVGLLTLDASPESRTMLALGIGPAVGAVFQLTALSVLSPGRR